MKKPNPIVAQRDADGTSVVDVRTLPEDLKCEIIMAAFTVAAHYGNGDIETPEGGEPADAFDALEKATSRIENHMHRIPTLARGSR